MVVNVVVVVVESRVVTLAWRGGIVTTIGYRMKYTRTVVPGCKRNGGVEARLHGSAKNRHV